MWGAREEPEGAPAAELSAEEEEAEGTAEAEAPRGAEPTAAGAVEEGT